MKPIRTRLLCAALALVLLCGILSGAAPALAASDGAVGGEFGSGMTWTLEDGVLTISGSGNIPNYEAGSSTPWYSYNTDESPITALVVEDGVTSVGDYAFEYLRQLQTVELGKSVQWIHGTAFVTCTNITSFTVDPDNPYFCHDENGWLFSKDKTVLVKYIGSSDRQEYTVPDTITRIEGYAFAYTGQYLEKVTIHENMEYIGDGAFAYCGFLREVNLLGCGYMGKNAFRWDSLLETVYIGPKATLGESAFYGLDRLSSVTIADGVESIAESAFEDCDALTEITIPGSVKRIGKKSFSYCYRLTRVNIEEGVESIADSAFEACFDLVSVTIPGSVRSMGEYIFRYCESLKSVTLGEGITSLGTGMFVDCGLTKISLPSSLRSISNYALCFCPIRTITIPENVNLIGRYIFDDQDFDNEVLTTIIFEGDAPSNWGSWGIAPFSDAATIYYRASKNGWSTPTWESPQGTVYNAYPILGEGEIDFSDENYYSKLSQRHFSFVTGTDQPVYGASLTMGGATLTAQPDSDSLAAVIPADTEQAILFAKDGMFDVTIPAEMFGTFNTVEFYPDDTAEPFVQAVYGRNVYETKYGSWADLLHDGMSFKSGSLTQNTQLYVDVNWNGANGKIRLSQHSDGTGGWELSGGWCEADNYAADLIAGLPLYLVLETTDGRRYTQELKAVITPGSMDLEADVFPQMDIDESLGGDAFSGFDLKLDFLDKFQFTFTMTDDNTVIGLFGITASEAEFKGTYDLVKESMYSPEDYAENFTFLEGLIAHKGGIVGPTTASQLGISAETQFIGWMEGEYVLWPDGKYHLMFKEGAVAVKVEGKMSYTYQMVAPPPVSIPVYIRPSLEPYVQFTLPVTRSETTGMAEFEPVTVTIHIPLKIAAGLGWDSILSAGIYGQGSFTLEGPVNSSEINGYMEAQFGMEASFFCLSADVVLAQTDPVYFLGAPSAKMLTVGSQLLTQAHWQLQPRTYLNAPSLSELPAAAADEDWTLTRSAVTEDAIYPYADVQIAELDGCRVAVWTEDDPNRTDANRTVLYYSYDAGEGWSAPEAVNNDGTADFDPVLEVVADSIYVVWKNANRALTAEDTVDTIPGAIDLRVARFNQRRHYFSSRDMVSIGTDYYDTCVDLTAAGTYNQPYVVWASNSANSIFGGAGATCSIYRYSINEEKTELLAEGLSHVDGLAADGDTVWFTADTDGDPDTVDDRELFCWQGGEITQVTHDDVADTHPMVSNGSLVWYSNGALRVDEAALTLSGSTDRSQYLRSETMEAVLYVEDSPLRQSTLYALFNDGSGWGQPVELSGVTGNVGSFSAVLQEDGILSIVTCERPLDSESSNYLGEGAYLLHYTLPLGCELAVTGTDYVNLTMVPNGQLTLTVDVENRGTTNVQLAQITVTDEQGAPLVSTAYLADLSSGESGRLYCTVPLPEDLTSVTRWTVTVEAADQAEANAENNSAPLFLRLDDLSLEGARAKADDAKTTAVVLVVNRGQTDLTGIGVELLHGETLLAAAGVDSLAAGESCFVELTGDAVDDLTVLTLRVAAEGVDPETENIRSNNSCSVIVDGPKAAVFAVSGSAVTTDAGVSAVLSVYNSTAADQTCFLCAAAYDKDGRMIDVKLLNYTAAAGSSNTLVLDLLGGSDVATVRIFVLDQNSTPIQIASIIDLK